MPAPLALTRYPATHSVGKKKLLVLAPRKLFSSFERKAELKHFLHLCTAWKKLVAQGKCAVDFTILSTKHPLEYSSGFSSVHNNELLSSITGMEISTGITGSTDSGGKIPSPSSPNALALGNSGNEASLSIHLVDSAGIDKEELRAFLEQNSRDFSIPVEGWHHWPTTRGLVADSYALTSAAGKLVENGKFAGVLAVGWPIFDAALRISKDHSLPAVYAFSTPSQLEAEVEGHSYHEPVVCRELAAIRHGSGIVSFDVAGLRWMLKNYAYKQISADKMSDFENVLEVMELISDSHGLMQIVDAPHAHPHDRRSAVALLKQARATLDSHTVLHGDHFVSSKYCVAFNSPIELKDCSKSEIASARKSLNSLSSFAGTPLSKAGGNKIFSLVFTDASDASLNAFAKALSKMPDSTFAVRADSPSLSARLEKISGEQGVLHKMALLPQKSGKAAPAEAALMAASHAIVFPNAVSSLLHYENAVCAVHSARQAGVFTPAIVATAAAPFLLKDTALLPPSPSHEQVSSVLSRVSQVNSFAKNSAATERLRGWAWGDAALTMVEFISSRL